MFKLNSTSVSKILRPKVSLEGVGVVEVFGKTELEVGELFW
jgi:hypothetical protein